jgi:hypothetical protein
VSADSSARARHTAISATRRLAAEALLRCLEEPPVGATEETIHAQWRQLLASHDTLLPEGWYQPPPTGMSVLIGTPPHYHRTNFRSLRDPLTYPRPTIPLRNESLLFAYASPIHRDTGMIGDFQVCLYRGDDVEVRDHLAAAFDITAKLAAFAEPGMELRELHQHGERLARDYGLVNDTRSTSERPDLTNVGHTIPRSHNGPDGDLWPALGWQNMPTLARAIRRGLVLITREQHMRISTTMALTIEPQLRSARGMQASFHVIVRFLDSVKSIDANLDALLANCGMTDFLPPSALRALGS